MAQITINNKTLHALVRRQVIAILQEVVGDPDAGFVFSKEAQSRLQKSSKSKKVGRVIPAAEVFKKHGLKYAP